MSEQEIRDYTETVNYNMESRYRTNKSELGSVYDKVLTNHADQLRKFADQIYSAEVLADGNNMNYDSVKGMKEMAAHILTSQTQQQEMDYGMAR